jgi:hypothetical protein
MNTAEGPLVAITTSATGRRNLDRPCGWPRVHVPAGRTLPDVFNMGSYFGLGWSRPAGSAAGVASADARLL